MSYPPYPDYEPPPPPPAVFFGNGAPGPQANQMALWSMITGIVGCTLGLMCCGAVFGVAALTLGLISRGQIASSNGWQTGRGQAKAGIILGSIAIALSILITIVFSVLPLLL